MILPALTGLSMAVLITTGPMNGEPSTARLSLGKRTRRFRTM
jgi:hypothetical protein